MHSIVFFSCVASKGAERGKVILGDKGRETGVQFLYFLPANIMIYLVAFFL